MQNKSLRRHVQHLDKSLKFRLRIYFALALLFLILFIYDLIRRELNIGYGLLGILIGTCLGIVTSRMFHISWDTDAKRVVGRLDIFGIGILIFYVIVEIFRNQIVSYFTHGKEVTAVSFAILAGIMFGRVLGMRGKIIKVLKEEKVFG
jgi:hypothetical protein